MQIISYPTPERWPALLQRPVQDLSQYRKAVAPILETVKTTGDKALLAYGRQFDGYAPQQLDLQSAEWANAEPLLSDALKKAIQVAYQQIYAFHRNQIRSEKVIETIPGVRCWRKNLPIQKVGLYIPGGTAPLFSTVLMLGIPAQLAGCRQVVLCTPPQPDGSIHPAVLYAARLCGITQVFKTGGAQAIAAMAYGTESIPAVDKIFGPGNPWVTAAKQLVALDGVAIDLPAGPSEVCVVADDSARPEFIAADLLSQAEHGADSQVVLMTHVPDLPQRVLNAIEQQLQTLPRKEIAAAALENSRIFLVKSLKIALEMANAYAPEHLILQLKQAKRWVNAVENAGSVFLGHYTPESAGDYASGTNHTLPTNGYARAFAGVSTEHFLKKITFQEINEPGLALLGPTIIEMARAEGLEAHARAVVLRQQATQTVPSQQM
jgi:histidinol dehydrogenase